MVEVYQRLAFGLTRSMLSSACTIDFKLVILRLLLISSKI